MRTGEKLAASFEAARSHSTGLALERPPPHATEQRSWQQDAVRLPWLDLGRTVALVLMVFGHMCDALLERTAWGSAFGQAYRPLRGVTAPLFLTISGWAFAAASLPRHAQHAAWGPAVQRRLYRAAALVFWGSFLALPWWAEGFPFHASAEVWKPFLSFGVLHCMAGCILFGQGLLRIAPSALAVSAYSLAAGLLALGVSPSLQRWTQDLPAFVRHSLFASAHSGGFALLPWAPYFLAGLGLGAFAWHRCWTARHVSAALSVTACGLLLVSLAMSPSWMVDAATVSPLALFARRLGIALGLLATFVVVSQRLPRQQLLSLVRIPARRTLTFYVGHLAVIWGVPGIAGLRHHLGTNLSFASCALLTVFTLAAIGGALGLARSVATRIQAALPPPAPAGEAPSRELRAVVPWPWQALRESGVELNEGRLIAKKGAWPIDRCTRVEVEARGGTLRLVPYLVAAAAVGIPASLALDAHAAGDFSWLVGLPVLVGLGACFHVLTASRTYRVWIEVEGRRVTVSEGEDPQRAIRLVAALRDAIASVPRAASSGVQAG
jgi:hypothetical protein